MDDQDNTKTTTEPGLPADKTAETAKKRLVIAAVILAVTLLGAGLALSFRKDNRPADQPVSGFRQVEVQSDGLVRQAKFSDALAMWNRFLAGNPSREEQVSAYRQIAAIHQNNKDLPAAIAAYRKAEELAGQPTLALTLQIASLSERAGDKATAADYYQRAIALLDPEDPMFNADKKDLENKVRSLR